MIDHAPSGVAEIIQPVLSTETWGPGGIHARLPAYRTGVQVA